jgi:hypothetical protein
VGGGRERERERERERKLKSYKVIPKNPCLSYFSEKRRVFHYGHSVIIAKK